MSGNADVVVSLACTLLSNRVIQYLLKGLCAFKNRPIFTKVNSEEVNTMTERVICILEKCASWNRAS